MGLKPAKRFNDRKPTETSRRRRWLTGLWGRGRAAGACASEGRPRRQREERGERRVRLQIPERREEVVHLGSRGAAEGGGGRGPRLARVRRNVAVLRLARGPPPLRRPSARLYRPGGSSDRGLGLADTQDVHDERKRRGAPPTTSNGTQKAVSPNYAEDQENLRPSSSELGSKKKKERKTPSGLQCPSLISPHLSPCPGRPSNHPHSPYGPRSFPRYSGHNPRLPSRFVLGRLDLEGPGGEERFSVTLTPHVCGHAHGLITHNV